MKRFLYRLKRVFSKRITNVNPLLAGTIIGTYFTRPKYFQSPTFQGIPVAGTLLIHQSIPYFQAQFPKLEVCGVFAPSEEFHEYIETGHTFGVYPTGCRISIPIYEKLSIEEEERLGKALLKKPVVGVMVIEGECKVGCATATIKSINVYRLNSLKKPDYEKPIWSWIK
jgi:hypothetical protein